MKSRLKWFTKITKSDTISQKNFVKDEAKDEEKKSFKLLSTSPRAFEFEILFGFARRSWREKNRAGNNKFLCLFVGHCRGEEG
jgi:hypothetical protein